MSALKDVRRFPSFCYNCVSGPDFLQVKVEDGVAVEVEPNFKAADIHPGRGRPCVKAYGLVQKTYNPHRILTPMKRTNPKKGIKENPGFTPISWDEAFDIIAARLNAIKAKGLIDESGAPRLAASFGHGGTPANYMGSFPAFLAAWGPIDYSFGSGQGVKCTHSEHLYGEFWHRAFTVAADTPRCNYLISCGANVEVTGGPTAVIRHADARVRGYKRVHVEPHLSITASCSAEWVPIRPKTDPAFLFALIHVLVCEHGTQKLDLPFLRDRTASPYLIGPDGFYLRDADSEKPLVFDTVSGCAVAHDAPGAVPAVDGRYKVSRAITIGPDGARENFADIEAPTAHETLIEHMAGYSPEWAEQICDVPAKTIRRIANEYLEAATIGATIEIDGQTLPLRPVAVTLGKSVNNGWGAYECCWARTVLAALVGALENPGGLLGTTLRINKPQDNRHKSAKPGEDGFMVQYFNPTSAEAWEHTPTTRNLHRSLVPIVGRNGGWSQALGPTQLAWLLSEKVPDDWNFPQPTYPELWFVFRSNPAISFWQTRELAASIAKFPFMVAFAYTLDETNAMADILLPDATDFETNQLIKISNTKYMEHFWRHTGVVLRAKAVEPQGDARDFSWISGELARRVGLLEKYVTQLNRGVGGVAPLKSETYDFSLDPAVAPKPEEIWDAACKAATAALSGGTACHGLDWFREHGFWATPMSELEWYLTPTLAQQGLRYELPYQERLMRVGQELGNRLHEKNMRWWDEQLAEYVALPGWHDIPGRWTRALENAGCAPENFPFWLLSTKSMQYHSGGNAGIALMDEVSQNLHGHTGVMMNADTAAKLGIAEGDRVEVRSQIGATYGRAALMQGVRPDTIVILGQFDHWATPYIKDQERASLNTIAPMSIELTDATGSGADIVRVAVRRMERAAP
ncbi:molybdopterin oxidoreductase [Rhodoblastus sphagnicola]|uniref:Molybdopterin oxidoreductase n=1 Tax=Rhodoblastus sphagnicola TaxID=333368 RepID=A0A2S6N019_9HYPH|nr:molybdopterin-dependent oxidoreductase [Rhodoblastus sphagnicola]MBB4197899.1 phenylacetyl-CoA:acceptor oxidoreductase [Rhodoblastus sphagnicola]PPQ27952.1 molybdopterin oxidoreductase [Rhodoblastus sphagnicola]